jgi:hypothetical protein
MIKTRTSSGTKAMCCSIGEVAALTRLFTVD